MSQITFAFDVGTNSLGSAVVDKANHKILHAGVNVFPMGVNLEKGANEKSKNAERREKRQARRQNFRRKMRKQLLVKELIPQGMFPDVDMLYDKYVAGNATHFRDRWQAVMRLTPLPDELQSYFAMDPYFLRHKAFKEDKLTLRELGRIFYHLAQRRGYKESLQDDGEDKGVLYDGKPADGKRGISETRELVKKYGTLGNALYQLDPHKERYRNRYTLRSMYEEEFHHIFRSQQPYHLETLTEDFYDRLGKVDQHHTEENGILFYQRRLRSNKHLLANCSLEPDKPRAPASCLDFERYRALQVVNNLKVNGFPLEQAQWEAARDYLLSSPKSRKVKELAKKLKINEKDLNFAPDDTLPGAPFTAKMSKIFKKQWDQLTREQKEDIWHLKYWSDNPGWLSNKLQRDYNLSPKAAEDFQKIKIVKDYAHLSRKAIRAILVFLERGYLYNDAVLLAGVRKAYGPNRFDDLDPHDQQQFEEAILNVAKDARKGGTSIDRVKDYLKAEFQLKDKDLKKLYHHSLKELGDGSMEKLPEPENLRNPIVMQSLYQLRKTYNALVDRYGRPDEVRVELTRELKSSKNERDKIRNAQKEREAENDAVKEILDEYGKPHTPQNIQKVKLANEIKAKAGRLVNPFRPNENFSMAEILDDGLVEIEHIVPYSVSLNDSLGNKTLADKTINNLKRERTPYQYFIQYDPEAWEEIKANIFKILPYHKAKKFVDEKAPLADSFLSRQLNDTRYISSKAKEYLTQVCKKVEITEGGVTSKLRYFWGLDGIITPYYQAEVADGEYLAALDKEEQIIPESIRPYSPARKKKDMDELAKLGTVIHGQVKNQNFYLLKQREDHRHHALDAIVTAFAERSYLQKLSTLLGKGVNKKELKYSREYQVPEPWERFRTDVRKAIEQVLVDHVQNNKVVTKVKKRLYTADGKPFRKNGKDLYGEGIAARGQLHEETVFGLHEDKEGNQFYHRRVGVENITNQKQLDHVVDPFLRELILQRVSEELPEQFEGTKQNWKISPKQINQVYFYKDDQGILHSKIQLPNAKGEPIPVKKVRIKERIPRALKLKRGINQYVKTGGNYCCIVYRKPDETVDFEILTFKEAVSRSLEGRRIFQIPEGGASILNTFVLNDLYVLGLSDEEFEYAVSQDRAKLSDHLFRVQKMSPSSYKVEFRNHLAATVTDKRDWAGFASGKSYLELNPRPVRVLTDGRIIALGDD